MLGGVELAAADAQPRLAERLEGAQAQPLDLAAAILHPRPVALGEERLRAELQRGPRLGGGVGPAAVVERLHSDLDRVGERLRVDPQRLGQREAQLGAPREPVRAERAPELGEQRGERGVRRRRRALGPQDVLELVARAGAGPVADEVGEQELALATRQRSAGQPVGAADRDTTAEPDLPPDVPRHCEGTLPLRQPFSKVRPRRRPGRSRVFCATVGPVNAPAPGTELVGGYRLGPPAAQGAMGSIYEATDPDGRRIAAKRLLDERHAARFEIEGRLLSRFDHPRVVKVLGMVEDPSGRYLMMEWVDGEDLAHLLRREGTPGLAEEQVVKIALEAAEALRYVHEQQTVHRDVKPQNLMLAPGRGVVLVDFGIARDLAVESATEGIGTPGYMAPEAFMGGPVSPRTDVYGLAMTAWTLLTSVPARYASVQPPEGTSPSLLATLDAALAVDPERRLPSMQAFAEGLGGRLPTERGRDIGVSAAVGEATARVLSAVVKTAAGVFDAAATSIALRRRDGGLDYQAAWGAGADEVVGMRLRPGQGIAGRVLATGVGEVVQDCRNDPDFAAAAARRTGYVPYTMIVVPLIQDDVAVGVLTVLDKRDGSSYDVGDLARGALFADLALAAMDAEPGARAALTTAVGRGV